MQTKTYLVTNNGEGSICVTGRTRIDIPARCRDMKLALPEATARQTVSRLKQRYPLLKIVEVKDAQTPPAASAGNTGESGKSDPATNTPASGAGKQETAPQAAGDNQQQSASNKKGK